MTFFNYRQSFLVILFSILSFASATAQVEIEVDDFPTGNLTEGALLTQMLTGSDTGMFTGAMGATIIDDQVYIGMRLQPEISFKKIGIGLDIPLLFRPSDGSFRSDEFKDGPGIARMVRYLRWGRKKQDPLYFQVGDISGTTLGFGFQMYQYSNVANYEKRPIGAEIDLNYQKKIGVEAVIADFSKPGVVGFRPYVRPLRMANKSIPVLKNLEIGLVYAADKAAAATPGGEKVESWGADIGIPISLSPMVLVVPYAAWASFSNLDTNAFSADSLAFDPGSGAALGVNFRFNFVANVFSLNAKIERRFYDDHFVGSYFNAVYEINKLNFLNTGTTSPLSRLESTGSSRGIFGALYGHVINKIIIGGSLVIPDGIARDSTGAVINGAYLHLEANAPDLIPRVFARATYDRNLINNLGDAIKLDEHSVAGMRIAYKMKPYLLVGADYKWTFARIAPENEAPKLKATSYVFPFVALQLNFNMNSQK